MYHPEFTKSTQVRYRDAMEWLEQSMDNCSVQRTLDVIGEKWTFLVLREAFHGVRRFAEMQEHTGAPRPVLAKRLAKLVDEDLLVRVPYQEPGQRERYEYQLTPKGLDLYPAVTALREWGDRYLVDPDGPARTFLHRGCGATSWSFRMSRARLVPEHDWRTNDQPSQRAAARATPSAFALQVIKTRSI